MAPDSAFLLRLILIHWSVIELCVQNNNNMLIDPHLAFLETSFWTNIFTLDDTVTIGEKIVRPMIVYAALIVLLRVFGKRELAQLNPFDLVVILSLSNTVQNAIIGPDNSVVGGLIGAASLLAINFCLAKFKWSSRPVESFIEGSPVVLIDKGNVNERALKRELITRRDLDIIAHNKGFEDAGDIERLVLDPNGSFLVDGKDEVKDARFKVEILKRISDLTKQITDLTASLQKS